VEVRYAIDYLTGRRREPRMDAVTVALGAQMLMSKNIAASIEEGEMRLNREISSGHAAERFARMVSALGGPASLLEKPDAFLPSANIVRPVFPLRAGFVQSIDTRQIGLSVLQLGGGRTRSDEEIDHSVGLTALAATGASVGASNPLATIHARDENSFLAAAKLVREAYLVGETAPPRREAITERLSP
jgi:thymidine phosphorylase